MEKTLSQGALDQIFGRMLEGHPWPWVVNQDWTHEIVDDRRQLIIKCVSAQQADEIISYAEDLRARRERAETEMPALLEHLGITENA